MTFLANGLLLLIAILKLGVSASEVNLSPKIVNAVEKSSATLTCSKTNGHLLESRWTNSQIPDQNANLYNLNGQCMTTRFLQNNDLFNGVCNGDGTFSVILNRIDRSQHGAEWQCRESLQSTSNKVTVNVAVPLTNVDVYLPKEIYLKENHPYEITCNTSACRPQPKINWYLLNPKTYVKHNLTEMSTQTTTESMYGLVTAESLLRLEPNRTVNDWMLYCEAWTHTANTTLASKQIALNISYPPESGPVIVGYESVEAYPFIEFDQVEFSCSVTGGNPLAKLTWNCFNSEPMSTSLVNQTVVSNILWKAIRHQSVCSCESNHIFNGKQATTVNLNVLYPPTNPSFKISSKYVYDVINIIQNKTLKVKCESRGNPTPNYTWNGPDMSDKMEQTLTVSNMDINKEGKYECAATNRMVRLNNTHRDGRNISFIEVKVLYPPGKPQFRYGNKYGTIIKLDSIDVIKRDTFSIYCDVTGYPTPDIIWHDSKTERLMKISRITSDANITCNATNMMNGTVGESLIISTLATLLITVFYPPETPMINVSIKNGNKKTATGRIHIIERETVELECSSKSRPTAKYTWFVNTTNKSQENVYSLINISRKDAGNYTCHVNNLMNRTFGDAEEGTNSSNIFLDILYPSVVGSLSQTSLKEMSTLNITCPVIPGNPVATEVFWTRKRDHERWNSSQLIILNVSKTDDTEYTCTVFNEMIPTVGETTKTAKTSKFHLNVFFPAFIKLFSESGKYSREDIVVNETQEVTLRCAAEANPASDITIRSPQNKTIAMVSKTNTLNSTITNSSCINAGEYICTCSNNYTNGYPSISKLTLIVRCPPKHLSDNAKDGKIAATLHAQVTLQFTARDYLDESNKTTFMWFKENASIENNDHKFTMSSQKLQSSLSITNITENDFGIYKVRVSNTVGHYNHSFELVARDKPEAPTNFAYIVDSITDSSVTLKWMPGFNGGYPQTFILLYKRNTQQQWQNTSVKDDGAKDINYKLSSLFSMMAYRVKMFARNEEGVSADTETLHFTTKAQISTQIEPQSSSTIGIVAGSVSSTVFIVAVAAMIVGVLIYRKRTRKETARVYQNVPITGNHIRTQRNCDSVQIRDTLFDGLQEVDDVPVILNERTEYCNSPEIIDKIDRIKVTELFSYVSSRNEESFEADYQKLPTELQKPCTFARKPENIALNRYNGIYPYDHSRVKLNGYPDFFINACYIDGYKRSKAYIASLGPTAKTTSDFKMFWKMIWYERSDVIVMLTNLREPSGMKCEKYWPEGGAVIWYGDVCVSCQAIECFAEYTIRTFTLSKEEECRSLTHLHYTAWPDKTVPEDVTSLIEFRQRMKATPTTSEGPVVVHCRLQVLTHVRGNLHVNSNRD